MSLFISRSAGLLINRNDPEAPHGPISSPIGHRLVDSPEHRGLARNVNAKHAISSRLIRLKQQRQRHVQEEDAVASASAFGHHVIPLNSTLH